MPPALPAPIGLSRAAFLDRLDGVLGVYDATLGLPDKAARREIVRRHTTYDGFAARAYLDGDVVVGFAYGFRGEPGQWWHDQVAGLLPPRVSAAWLSDCFELAEIHVRPSAQGRGLGTALLDALLGDVTASTVLLSVHADNRGARRLYASFGFTLLAEPVLFGGALPAYAVMGCPVPRGSRVLRG